MPKIRHPLALLYGLVAYVLAVRAMVYVVGFCGGWWVPKSIDTGSAGEPRAAFAINVLLLAGFALLHSFTARRGWKRWHARLMPEALERSTYALLSGLSLSAVMWFWQPLPAPVWNAEADWLRIAITALSLAGWALCVAAVHTLGHFDLFGLRPACLYAVGREPEERGLVKSGLYARLRHPLYAGFLVAIWAAPTMSRGHLLFSALSTAYIALGIGFEERDLVRRLGADYVRFRKRVPRFLPRFPWWRAASAPAARPADASTPPRDGRRR